MTTEAQCGGGGDSAATHPTPATSTHDTALLKPHGPQVALAATMEEILVEGFHVGADPPSGRRRKSHETSKWAMATSYPAAQSPLLEMRRQSSNCPLAADDVVGALGSLQCHGAFGHAPPPG